MSADVAKTVAGEISKECANNSDFINASFERVLARLPSAAERSTCEAFLGKQLKLLNGKSLTPFAAGGKTNGKPKDLTQRVRESLLLVLLNHNDFVTVR